uniref:Uncharacterized protein n=1 Tax=Aegilops tauschii subsp. strangulata TaxID=200361 RepID=A0A453D7U4_AEGTS
KVVSGEGRNLPRKSITSPAQQPLNAIPTSEPNQHICRSPSPSPQHRANAVSWSASQGSRRWGSTSWRSPSCRCSRPRRRCCGRSTSGCPATSPSSAPSSPARSPPTSPGCAAPTRGAATTTRRAAARGCSMPCTEIFRPDSFFSFDF